MFAKCLTSLSLRKADFKKNFNQHFLGLVDEVNYVLELLSIVMVKVAARPTAARNDEGRGRQ
jgi:hypothetical protein